MDLKNIFRPNFWGRIQSNRNFFDLNLVIIIANIFAWNEKTLIFFFIYRIVVSIFEHSTFLIILERLNHLFFWR